MKYIKCVFYSDNFAIIHDNETGTNERVSVEKSIEMERDGELKLPKIKKTKLSS